MKKQDKIIDFEKTKFESFYNTESEKQEDSQEEVFYNNDEKDYAKEYLSTIHIEKIPFSSMPKTIKATIIRTIIGATIFLFFAILLLVFITKNIFVWLFFFLLSASLYVSAIIKYLTAKYNVIVKFEGIIVSTQIIGLMKATKYQIIKISNGEKFLNIKTSIDKKAERGVPITVYLPKDTKITDSEYGPLAETFISYTLSVSSDDESSKLTEEGISASDYVDRE